MMNQRHASEEKFHDNKYDKQTGYPYHYRYNPTYHVFQEMKGMLGDVRGKTILEYGCGEGWTTAEIAAMGGEIHAFDISSVAIGHALKLLEKRGLAKNCVLKKMGAEQLDYPDNFFDSVFGFAILHHLDLDRAMPEMYRVLKAGAEAFFAEPLGTNPLINLYRNLTPQYRTKDEAPLILEEFTRYGVQFREFKHIEYYLTAICSLGLAYLRLPQPVVHYFNRMLLRLDRKILYRYPYLGRYAWYTIIKLVK